MVCSPVDYVLRDVPGCDGSEFRYISSAAQCNAAADAVGYSDTTASQGSDGGNTFPEGCYTRNNALYFNEGAAATNYLSSPTRVSICVTGATESPTAANEACEFLHPERLDPSDERIVLIAILLLFFSLAVKPPV